MKSVVKLCGFANLHPSAFSLFLALLLAGLPLTAKVRVVTTTTMITDLVQDIGADNIHLTGMMNPGVDPHLYKTKPSDIQNLQRANVVFYNGLFLEGKIGNVLKSLARKGKMVFAITATMPRDRLLEPPEFSGNYDPHVWFDPTLWQYAIEVVVDGLSQADPTKAENFARNGTRVQEEYLALHAWASVAVEQILPEARILITSHDAFNYFGLAYGFQVVGVQGISTATEAGLADMVKMVDFIKQKGVRAIFIESSVAPAAIESISRDAGVKIGGELFSDAMGITGETETRHGDTYDLGTYEGMIKHNVYRIVDALK